MKKDRAAASLRDRIAAHVVARITAGDWQAGDRIPSENALSQAFEASRMTVHHALRDLTAKGFLIRRSGSGTFVAEARAYVAEYDHLDVIEEITTSGGQHHAQVLRRDLRPATEAEAAMFALPPGEAMFHALILHLRDGEPFELEDRLIASRFLPDAMAIDLSCQTLFSRLMLVRPHREGSEGIRAVMPGAQEQQLLRITADTPCLEVTRRTWSSEGTVTLARMLRSGPNAAMQGQIRTTRID